MLRDKAEYGVLPTAQENSVGDASAKSDEDSEVGRVGSPWAANEVLPRGSSDAAETYSEGEDPLLDYAVRVVRESGNGSVAGLQRNLKIRYNLACRLVSEMERIGVVSAADERGSRQVLATPPADD